MVLGYSVWASALLVRVHGLPSVYGGALWPECGGPVQWGRQVVLGRVVLVVVRVCRLRLAPWHWWKRWQGLVVVVGVFMVHVKIRCGRVRRVGWMACGVRLCWGGVVMELVGVAKYRGIRGWGSGLAGPC